MVITTEEVQSSSAALTAFALQSLSSKSCLTHFFEDEKGRFSRHSDQMKLLSDGFKIQGIKKLPESACVAIAIRKANEAGRAAISRRRLFWQGLLFVLQAAPL